MSKVIDERVVQMSFDNSDFESGIKKSGKSLNEFDSQINKTASSNGNLDGLTNAVTGVGKRFTLMGTIATGALLSIGAKAVELGQNLINSIAVEPITQGWNEYELKINSIKTMLASGKTREGLPVTLEMVNEQLADLNKYSDQTIYSFADMTQNIGKFTNAGVALPDAVNAIKGVANAAALSGSSAEEASRAMYNFSQALSTGFIKLIDWKSIENANMATVEFKQQLLDSAVAAGTLTKNADGMYSVLTTNGAGTSFDATINATKNFNDSLQYQWLTTTALTDTLSDYADANTEIGARATDAATKVRTFTQFMDTTKEAVGSGWAQTFELLIGNYDEATTMFSALSNITGKWINDVSNARNNIIKDVFSRFGGRANIAQIFVDAWKNLVKLITPIKDAFRIIFGNKQASTLADIIGTLLVKFRGLVDSLDVGWKGLRKIRILFEGFFSALWIGWEVIDKFIKAPIAKIFEEIFSSIPGGNSLLDQGVKIAQFFIRLRLSIKNGEGFGESSKKVLDSIHKFFVKIKEYTKKLKESEFSNNIKVLFNNIKEYGEDFRNSNFVSYFVNAFDKIMDFVSKLKDSGIADKIKNFLTSIKDAVASFFTTPIAVHKSSGSGMSVSDAVEKIQSDVEPTISFFDKVKSSLISIKDWFVPIWAELVEAVKTNWKPPKDWNETKSFLENIMDMVVTGGLLYSLLSLVKSFKDIAKSASGFMNGITGVLDGVRESLEAYQLSLKAKALKEIAISVGILAASLIVLSLIKGERLNKATYYITVLFAELSASMLLFEKSISVRKMSLIAANLVGLASSVMIISLAIGALAIIPKEKIQQGVLAVTSIMGMLNLFVATTSRTKGRSVLAASAGLLIMSVAMTAMTAPVIIMGKMDPARIKQGLYTMGLILTEISAFALLMSNKKLDKSLLSSAVALLGVSRAMSKMGLIIRNFGNMDEQSLVKSTAAVGVLLAMMVTSLKVLGGGSLKGVVAMMGIAAAVNLIVPAVIAFGSVPIEVIVAGLLALAGVFAIIGAAAYLLSPMAPGLLAITAAILLFGGALFLVTVGIGAAAAGIALLVGAVIALTNINSKDVRKISEVIGEVAKSIPLIMAKFGEGIIDLAVVIRDGAPVVAQALIAIIDQFVILLIDSYPTLVKALFGFITMFLEEVRTHFPEWAQLGLEMWGELLSGFKENLPQIQNDTQEIITEFMIGLAEGIPEMAKAGADLIVSYLKAIEDESPRIIDQGFKTVISFINGLAEAIRTHTPELLDAGVNLMTSFIDGVLEYLGVTNGESEQANNISKSIMSGLITGLNPLAAGAQMLLVAEELVTSIKDYLGVKSPSTVFFDIANDVIDGFVDGIKFFGHLLPENLRVFMDDAVTEISGYIDDFLTVGEDLTESIATGITNKVQSVMTEITNLGEEALTTIGWVWDMHSPSKKFIAIGKNAGLSIASGIGKTVSSVANSITDVGKSALNSATETSRRIAEALNTDMNSKPVITPVLDLSMLRSGAGSVASLLSNGSSYGLAVNASSIGRGGKQNQNGSSNSLSSTTTINNTFEISGVTIRNENDIKAVAEKLHEMQEKATRGLGKRSAYAF